jgi:hypothetical protein
MDIKIVVSRYNEDISWLLPLKHYCIFINKGEPLQIENEIRVENIGREGHSYLWFILNNYENLPDVVVFTQANIKDHIDIDNIKYLETIIKDAVIYNKSMPNALHNYKINKKMNGELGPVWNYKDDEWYLKNNYLNNQPQFFIDWFIKNIKPEYPNPTMYFYMNGIFAVKKDLILNHTKEFYGKLIKSVDHHIDPAEGHFLERSWYHIFE